MMEHNTKISLPVEEKNSPITLYNMRKKEHGKVITIEDACLRRYFKEMGFPIPFACCILWHIRWLEVVCIRVEGMSLSLRKEEAKSMIIRKIETS